MNHWKTTVGSDYVVHLEDPDGWWTAAVRSDGCIDLNKYFNAPVNQCGIDQPAADCDSIHICDLDDFIERLQSLRACAIAQFGEDWPQ